MVSLTPPRDTADQYAKIRQYILNGNPRKIRILAVTSAGHGEGSTTVAAQLALSLASNPALSILLVDANLRKPDIHRLFQVEQENGLTDFLRQKDFHTVLKKASINNNLTLLTSGKSVSDPSEFFNATDIEQKLIREAVNFDHVIMDCPPVNAYPETTMLASHCDGVILVVQAGETRRELVLDAQEQMIHAKVNLLGVVLNRRKYYIPDFLYKNL